MMTIAGSNNRYLEYFLHVNNFRHADIRALCSLVNSLVNPFLFSQVFIYFKIHWFFNFKQEKIQAAIVDSFPSYLHEKRTMLEHRLLS